MPTYEYKCKACSHAFERFQSMTDAVLRRCPACGKNTLERLIGTGAAVLFRGSGFYQTDYRSEAYNAAKKAESAGTNGQSSKPDAVKSQAPAEGSRTESKADPAAAGAQKKRPGAAKPASRKSHDR